MIGVVAGLFSLILSFLAVPLVNRLQPTAELLFNLPLALLMVTISILIAVFTTLVVSWKATSIKPLEVLSGE